MTNDFGKKSRRKIAMGGEGSGNWYRFNKKTTVEECRSLDVRRLHREEGLLRPGWLFSWSWSRSGREMASIGGLVEGEDERSGWFCCSATGGDLAPSGKRCSSR